MAIYNFFSIFLESIEIKEVNPWLVLPFITLLVSIAVMPFIDRHWWEKNYPLVSFLLSFAVIGYYFLVLHNIPRLFLTSYDYISFISLIGSLFVVTGGIHVKIPGKTTPIGNTAILAAGAVLANLLGTT